MVSLYSGYMNSLFDFCHDILDQLIHFFQQKEKQVVYLDNFLFFFLVST